MATMTNEARRQERHLKELMMIFDFTADELDQNRAGQMSERQATTMRKQQMMSTIGMAIIFIVMAVIMYGVFISAFVPNFEQLDFGLIALMTGLFVLLPTAFLGYTLWALRKWWSNRDDVTITQVEGTVSKKRTRIRRDVFYDMTIGVDTFHLDESAYTMIGDGMPYRVYFVDSKMHIIAMEPITTEDV